MGGSRARAVEACVSWEKEEESLVLWWEPWLFPRGSEGGREGTLRKKKDCLNEDPCLLPQVLGLCGDRTGVHSSISMKVRKPRLFLWEILRS